MSDYEFEDFRFEALKSRLRSFEEFEYSPRGRVLELEGIFVYKSSSDGRGAEYYSGYLDLAEEYRMLGLHPPEGLPARIWCVIPSKLAARERLLAKPNIRVCGRVYIDAGKKETKHLLAEDLQFLPVVYRAVGSPEYDDFWDMFSAVYKRDADLHENAPLLLLASLVGSGKPSLYFPDENAGCGINIGRSSESVPGMVGGGRVTPSMKRNLEDLIRKVNTGSLNKVSDRFRWNRFLSVTDHDILARRVNSPVEIDWNLCSDLEHINNVKSSEFIASDMNLVYDPCLFPPKLKKPEALKIKQTLLYARSTPPIEYSKSLNALMEVKTEKLAKELASYSDYAPFLFRYRLEPLCDAFLKGMHLNDYLIRDGIKIDRDDIKEFFKIAGYAAMDFATYAERYIEPRRFRDMLDGARDERAQDLLRELIVKGGMTEKQMIDYLIHRHDMGPGKAESMVRDLTCSQPALVVRKGELYAPL